ncbi:hypothetical protein ABIE26_002170 [Pedobacter africanus]|uniref:Uncharacterized protein n=1 Tax=Pedobacter africanus TaxID=151894 RepID=A0ACC6KZD5_9SPHI|nr:DUF5683 domain-containing protein [Pedobacter africanus]MDR6784441.1 hypothetical protein [Pedobacter africanus]
MYKLFLLPALLFFAAFTGKAQQVTPLKKDSTTVKTATVDSVKPYINVGKIAGRRAAIRSAMLPGLGQIRNGLTIYRGLKVAGIYTGATLLTISYIDNSKKYNLFVDELKYRAENPGQTQLYPSTPDDRLIQAKDIYRRNKQVIIFSYVGLYLLNIIEAYIDARLANFDVGDVASIKIRPDMINTGYTYGMNSAAPGIKIAISF